MDDLQFCSFTYAIEYKLVQDKQSFMKRAYTFYKVVIDFEDKTL